MKSILKAKGIILLFVFFGALILETKIYAQKYKLNQRIEVNVDSRGVWYKGYVKDVQGFENNNGYYIVHLDRGVDFYGGGTEFMVTSFNLIRPEKSNAGIIPDNCSFGPPPGNFTNTSPASVSLFKKVIYDRHLFFVNGTDERPKRIGITFVSFQNQKAYRNTDAGIIPFNAVMYPATVKYIVCEQYNVGIERKMIEAKYEFFIDRYGKWALSEDPYKKITKLE